MDKKAKILERVRALLAKAEGTNFPEEADAFRAKADELMTAYAIEAWQVEAAQNGVNQRVMPEKRDMDFSWYRGEFKSHAWWIFTALAQHCRCKAVTSKINYNTRTVPVIGLPADLDYLDLLFTHILLDFGRKVTPKPDPDRLSYEENLAMLKEAGLGWPEICRLMVDAGLLEYLTVTKKAKRWSSEANMYVDVDIEIPRPWQERKNYAKPAHDYRRWCKKTGRVQSYTDPRTYRRNFADGYEEQLSTRLRRMRREQEEGYDAKHEAGSMALVVRDIRQVIDELMWELFPDLKPHPADCECADCHTRKCKDPKCDRPRCKRKRKPIKYKPDTRK